MYIYFIYKNKKFTFVGVIINLFKVYNDPHQMLKEKNSLCVLNFFHLTSDESHHRPEINL